MSQSEWAVVVGCGLNALGVIRSLAQGGVNVAVLAKPGDDNPALQSKHPRLTQTLPSYEDLPEALTALAKRLGGKPVLFLTEEEAVRVTSKARDQLQEHYRFRLGDHELMMALTHKEGVQAHAEQQNMPIPKGVRLRRHEDLPALQDLRFPCVLKPGEKHDGYGARFKKAYHVKSVEEARALFEEISPVLPDLIVQEWIEGADDAIHFCLVYMGPSGRAVGGFTGRKLRAWPPQVGGTASCCAAPEAHEVLLALTERFFAGVGLQGMASMEYKRDARDGRFYVVEPTVGRTDFQEEVATINGCNLPLQAYCFECNLPVPTSKSVPASIWREPVTDRWSLQAQGDNPAFQQMAIVDAYFRWTDPRPWLALQRDRVRQRLARWL